MSGHAPDNDLPLEGGCLTRAGSYDRPVFVRGRGAVFSYARITDMKVYQSRYGKLGGTSYGELERKVRKLHNQIVKKTKRNAYVRSAYFKKDKVFLTLFWAHLNQKTRRDRKKRLRYYECAIDLLSSSPHEPEVKLNPNGKNELVYRFAGLTKEGDLFYVQVKEDRRTGNKYFMSVFPPGQS